MANYTIGDMVFESRTARGYSQEELSFGICSTSSLSRIENSSQIPGRKIFEALMQRLGVSDSLYSAYISREEMKICKLIQELVWSIERLEIDKCEKLVEEAEEKMNAMGALERQYIMFGKAMILLYKDKDAQGALELCMDAIHITIPDFSPETGIKRRLLTFHEITIIDNIAIMLYNKGEIAVGLSLQFDLKNYMETHIIDEEEKAKKYPLIIYNITTRLGELERYQEAYELCDQTITYCVEHNKLIYLPYLLTNMASAAAELGMSEKAKELFGQAHTLFKVCKKETLAEEVRQNAFSLYGLEIV